MDIPALDVNQLMHLKQFFQIKEEKGSAAAIEWAERIIEANGGKVPGKEKPHLTAVK